MMRAARFFAAAALVLVSGAAHAQVPVTARGAVLFESYSFKPDATGQGLIFKKVSELTVPIGVDVKLGRLGGLSLSSGLANVQLTSNDLQQLPNQTLTGALDTEARLSIDVVPGKLVLLATGVVPTGAKTVQTEQLAVLGAISSDVIGFSAPSLGSGGNVGGGFVGALPMGKFSAGFGATYKQSLSYQPVVGSDPLHPGAELRFRAGLEGALARRTFLRFAAIVAQSSPDRIGGAQRNGVGMRIITYLSVNQAMGKASITVYGFDVFRGSPQIESTPTGTAFLPRGNLLAGGAKLDYTVGSKTTLSPRLEYRASAAAADTSAAASFQRLGASFRFGVDARQSLTRRLTGVLQAGGVTGNVRQAGKSIPFSGLRAALSVEFAP